VRARSILLFTAYVRRYASPTPLGYADINTVFSVPVGNRNVLCELQFHLKSVLAVKKEAHEYYEVVRTLISRICKSYPKYTPFHT
jgi:hypothetical protein